MPSPKPTLYPTASPTPAPTPPPPPVELVGIQGTLPPEFGSNRGPVACTKKLTFTVVPGTDDSMRSDVQEAWLYDCHYEICTRMDLRPSPTTTCACTLSHSVAKDVTLSDSLTQRETTVSDASVWIVDGVTGVKIRQLPEFDFTKDPNTTDILAAQAANVGPDYTQVMQAFTTSLLTNGVVVPPELDTTREENRFNRAAICFTVHQTFLSTMKWPEPKHPPRMSRPPAVYVSPCALFTKDFVGGSINGYKRDVFANSTWTQEFYVFNAASSSYPSRMITSFYKTDRCLPGDAFVSVDRHFTAGDLEKTGSMGVYKMSRTFTAAYLVGGAPASFSDVTATYRDGYTRVTNWTECYARVGCFGAEQAGAVADALKQGFEDAERQIGPRTWMCKDVPAYMRKATYGCGGGGSTSVGCPVATAATGESHLAYPLWKSGLSGRAPFDCGKNFMCTVSDARDAIWIAFQNRGAALRDFSKNWRAQLLTSPRNRQCAQGSLSLGYDETPSFDMLKYRPWKATYTADDAYFRKRFELPAEHRVYDVYERAEAAAQVARKREALDGGGGSGDVSLYSDPVSVGLVSASSTAITQMGAGSVDANGVPAGDHPATMFPSTYALPMSVSPDDTSCLGYDPLRPNGDARNGCAGRRVDLSQGAPCVEGTLGCSCRTYKGTLRPLCDFPNTCSDPSGAGGFCVRTPCPAGGAGCSCVGGGCASSSLQCNATLGKCVLNQGVCAAGQGGCPVRTTGDACVSGFEPSPTGDYCVSSSSSGGGGLGVCSSTVGNAGCPCVGGTCDPSSGTSCDSASGMCMSAAYCLAGQPGCKCGANKRCHPGFTCTDGNVCVETPCPAGTSGCPCTAEGKCGSATLKCSNLYTTGNTTLCLSSVTCGPQFARCASYCGTGNIKVCPSCDWQTPVCFNANSAARNVAGASFVSLLVSFVVLASFSLLSAF